jgi:arylsulfatase A-like enzyme
MSVTETEVRLAPDKHCATAPYRPVSILRCLAIIIVPAVLLPWGKLQLLERGGFYHVARAVTGNAAVGDPSFTMLEKLTFFRADLLAAVIIMPLLTLLLAKLLGKLRTPIIALVALAMVWALYIEFQAQKQIGRFLSMHLLEDALRFTQTETGIAGGYVDRFAMLKPAACSLFILLAAWWASGSVRVREQTVARRRTRAMTLAAAIALPIIVTLTAWGPWLESNNMQRGVLTHIARAFQEFENPQLEAELANLSADQLISRYQSYTGSPRPMDNPAHFGVAAGCDVLLFVMETAPATLYDSLTDADLPNIARLRQRAWTSKQHHTTFPYTSHAVWSLLTSWYPSSAIGNYPDYARDRKYPGLMQSLKSAGYATTMYSADEFTFFNDDSMYALAGVDKRLYTYNAALPAKLPAAPDKGTAQLMACEQAAIDQLKADMTQWTRNNQRFASVFVPQIGHGPWRNMDGKSNTKFARGQSVIRFQDGYIGQIIDHLESLGRLDKTIIVVTGDHGVRARREATEFQPGMIGEMSFRVPLVLYCPPALSKVEQIPWQTSHIDVAPSILDLIGIRDNLRASEQGSPMWDERLRDRTLYFFAANYLGCDGYRVADGQCFMWNRIEGLTYQSNDLAFDAGRIIRDDAKHRSVMENIAVMDAVRKVWLVHAPMREGGPLLAPKTPRQCKTDEVANAQRN